MKCMKSNAIVPYQILGEAIDKFEEGEKFMFSSLSTWSRWVNVSGAYTWRTRLIEHGMFKEHKDDKGKGRLLSVTTHGRQCYGCFKKGLINDDLSKLAGEYPEGCILFAAK